MCSKIQHLTADGYAQLGVMSVITDGNNIDQRCRVTVGISKSQRNFISDMIEGYPEKEICTLLCASLS